jgi:hypothetical protein
MFISSKILVLGTAVYLSLQRGIVKYLTSVISHTVVLSNGELAFKFAKRRYRAFRDNILRFLILSCTS